MGSGRGKTRRAKLTVSSQGRRENKREALLSDFSAIGYQRLRDFPDEEKRIIDPGYSVLNASPKDEKPYSFLFRYCPNMALNKGRWVVVEIRADNTNGEIMVIGSVEASAGGSRVSVFRTEKCGRDLAVAVKKAEQIYDETFAQFQKTVAGKRARYVRSPERLTGDAQIMEHSPTVFSELAGSTSLVERFETALHSSGVAPEVARPTVKDVTF